MVSPVKRRSARRTQIDSTSESKSSPSSQNSPDLPPPTSAPADALSTRSAASSSSNRSDNMRNTTKRSKDDLQTVEDFQEPSAPPPPSSSHRRTSSIASTTNANASNNTHPHPPASSSTSSKRKRKGKDTRASPKEDNAETASVAPTETDAVLAADEKQDDDGGVTRCVCEGSEEDGDLGFMIQCELCMAWQHGPCMGFASESEIPSGDYYCEQCKPQDHITLLKKLTRSKRQASEKANASNASRASRSHSPTQFLKSAKRRNTMNSRDADYEAQLQKLLASTAAEADGTAADDGDKDDKVSVAKSDDGTEAIIEIGPGGRKKRKRIDEEVMTAKRKRSASVASEQISITAAAAAEKPDITTPVTMEMLPPPTPVTNKSRSRRGGNRKGPVSVTQEPSVNGDAEEALLPFLPIKKHPNQYTYRAKSGSGQNRRAPQSAAGAGQPNGSSHEHGTRRNANQSNAASGSGGVNARGGGAASQNSVQLPLFQSWGLPDYLSHLQRILPSEVPPPLQVRGQSSFMRKQNSIETSEPLSETAGAFAPPTLVDQNGTSQNQNQSQPQAMNKKAAVLEVEVASDTITERGAKIKWPAKRMSVADMNKRVRALVEWVGREQALGADRDRRRTALEVALKKQKASSTEGQVVDAEVAAAVVEKDINIDRMVVDGNPGSEDADVQAESNSFTPTPAPKLQPNHSSEAAPPRSSTPRSMFTAGLPNGLGANGRLSTDQMLEELMQELLNFQMRFGPGAKSSTRDRRVVAVS